MDAAETMEGRIGYSEAKTDLVPEIERRSRSAEAKGVKL
jgi:hypothetical protein